MTSEIKRIKKNLTYRIVTIDGEHYLMDTGTPFWKGLFPYSFWLFPHPAYKLDDNTVVLDLIEETNDDLGKTLGIGAAGGGLAFFLTPLVEYFDMLTSSLINGLILFLSLTVILLTRIYYSKLNKESINKIVDFEKLETEQLIIRPSSISYFFKFNIFYVFFLGMGIMSMVAFLMYGNIFILLVSMVLFFFILIFNITNVMPDETYGKLVNPQ
jgi:uncharacterized membrane protein (TIGR01218 family)